MNLKGPALRAVIETSQYALAQAAQADLDRKTKGYRNVGPLNGIPMLVKDNMATRASDGKLQS